MQFGVATWCGALGGGAVEIVYYACKRLEYCRSSNVYFGWLAYMRLSLLA